jgi:Flp pilus assembly protein TadG
MRRDDPRREHGQILVLFVLSLAAVLAIAALLIDGANALVLRRSLQNAADAAALAASNVLQASGSTRTCSDTASASSVPRTDIVTAAVASVTANVPGYTEADVIVTCPGGYDDQAVRVELRDTAPNFLAAMVLGGPLQVGTSSVAVNGQITGSLYSVVTLDPWNASYPNGRRGCPSVLLSGGPTVVFDGSIQVDSACPASDNGAFGTNGNAATVTLNNGSSIRIVGGFSPGPLTISPTPYTNQRYVPDPLAFLDPSPMATIPVRSNSRLVLNNATQVLQPGIYRGGIQLRNHSIALLRPGIYVLDGGGLDVSAQASFCSISGTSAAIDCSGWAASCPDATCGVLLYNTGAASGAGAMGTVSVAAGAELRLRAYDERAVVNGEREFRNILIWQSASPVPTSSYAQPVITLNGGGSVEISGTLYAPSATVQMIGTAGGSGGNLALTLQFIVWDLQIQGNASFRFYFSDDDFARPTDYGLIQ